MQQELWGERMISSDFKVKLEAIPPKGDEITKEISRVDSTINNIKLKLSSNTLDPGESVEMLINKQEYSCEIIYFKIKKEQSQS